MLRMRQIQLVCAVRIDLDTALPVGTFRVRRLMFQRTLALAGSGAETAGLGAAHALRQLRRTLGTAHGGELVRLLFGLRRRRNWIGLGRDTPHGHDAAGDE